MWITPERWAACHSPEPIPGKVPIYVGVDASWTGDATAVAWAHKRDDGLVLLQAHVWIAVDATDSHTRVHGDRIDFGAVEDFILSLAQSHRVREVVFDPSSSPARRSC